MAEPIIPHRVLRSSGVHLVTAAGFPHFRHLGRHRGGRDVRLAPEEDRAIPQGANERQERKYRIAGRTGTGILVPRLQRGAAISLTGQVQS